MIRTELDKGRLKNRGLSCLFVFLVAISIAACAPKIIRGEFVNSTISDVKLIDSTLYLLQAQRLIGYESNQNCAHCEESQWFKSVDFVLAEIDSKKMHLNTGQVKFNQRVLSSKISDKSPTIIYHDGGVALLIHEGDVDSNLKCSYYIAVGPCMNFQGDVDWDAIEKFSMYNHQSQFRLKKRIYEVPLYSLYSPSDTFLKGDGVIRVWDITDRSGSIVNEPEIKIPYTMNHELVDRVVPIFVSKKNLGS